MARHRRQAELKCTLWHAGSRSPDSSSTIPPRAAAVHGARHHARRRPRTIWSDSNVETAPACSSPRACLALSVNGRRPARDVVLEEVTLRGSVAAVDHYQRVLTVRAEQGNLVVVDVPVAITGVRPGHGSATSSPCRTTDRVTLRAKPAGEPAVDRDARRHRHPDTWRARRCRPAARHHRDLHRLGSGDAGGHLPRPQGRRVLTPAARHDRGRRPANLRPGDRVDVVWSEAIRLSFQGAAAPGRATRRPAASLHDLGPRSASTTRSAAR